MKTTCKLLSVAAIICLHGCSGCIKKSSGKGQTSVADGTRLPVPAATNNLVIKGVEDLPGYWAGEFRSEQNFFEHQGDFTINMSLDEIDGQAVKGHIVMAGEVRYFTCTMATSETMYSFTFTGKGDRKVNGTYKFSVMKGDSLLTGTWTPKKGGNDYYVTDAEYKLTKRLAHYNPDVKLTGGRYVDYRKSNGDTLNDQKYATITAAAYKYNASATLLTKEDAANLKKGDLLILRNSIFARHGYIFKDIALGLFFSEQRWYVPVKPDVSSELTDIENKNVVLLTRYEKTAQEYYDTFGR